MTVNRKELISALKNCLPGIESGGTILEGADSFIFKKDWIHSYNDKISVSVASPVKGLEGSVRAKEFFTILNKLSGEDIKFSIKDERWILKSGLSKVELSLLEEEIYERIVDTDVFKDDGDWNDLPTNFEDALNACKFGCNNSGLAGIIVSGNHMLSTDEFRINWYKLDSEIERFWINDPIAGELMKFTGLQSYYISSSWVHFKTKEGLFFSCRKLMDEKFPFDKCQALMEEKHAQSKEDITGKLPAMFLMASDRAASFSAEVNGFETINVLFEKSHILIKSQRSSGKYQEKIKWEVPFSDGFEPIQFIIDPDMVNYGLKRATNFYIKKHRTKIGEKVYLIFFNDNFYHLITTIQESDE